MKLIRTLSWSLSSGFLPSFFRSLFPSRKRFALLGVAFVASAGVILIVGQSGKRSGAPLRLHAENAFVVAPLPKPSASAAREAAEPVRLELPPIPLSALPNRWAWTRAFVNASLPARGGFLFSRALLSAVQDPSDAPPLLHSPLLRVGLMRFSKQTVLTLCAWPGGRLLGPVGSPDTSGSGFWTIRATAKGAQAFDAKGKSLGVAEPGSSWRLQGEEAETLVGVGTPGTPLRRYRGALEVAIEAGHLRVINEVDLESYLRSVIVGEMGGNAPLEALKAQAVAARTFALCSLGRWVTQGYDLRDTTDSQVYNGADVETATADFAVRETNAMILTQHGQPILAQYCADCGGMTTPGDTPDSCPRSVSDAEAHNSSATHRHPFISWSLTYTPEQFAALLNRNPLTRGTGDLENVTIAEKDVSGRVRHMQVTWLTILKSKLKPQSAPTPPELPTITVPDQEPPTTPPADKAAMPPPISLEATPLPATAKETATATKAPVSPAATPAVPAPAPIVRDITGNTLRTVLGLDNLRSTLFTIRRLPNKDFVLEGRGYGHGRGMCQIGAMALAAPPLSRSFRAILMHYYVGATLEHINYSEPEEEIAPGAAATVAQRSPGEIAHGR